MPTSTAILKSRLYPILPEVQAELEEILERILIVRVNGHHFEHWVLGLMA